MKQLFCIYNASVFKQGISFPAPPTLSNAQYEEDWGHEERRHFLCRVPQSLHPLAAAITHPRSGAGVRIKHHRSPVQRVLCLKQD